MLRKVDRYELLEELGHGGMATVYRARDTRLLREVAVKVMHPHLRSAPHARERFAREAKTVARLKHPNILEIYDFSGEESDESYIATELLSGPTLRQFLEKNPEIPPEIVACFGLELARALGAAHVFGIVHRDVKPENVLIHNASIVKLADFGIAQIVDAQGMTATGQLLGSPGHMAPEQIEGKECDGRTDLFSLGTLLYVLATGKPSFPGKNPHQILKKIVDGDFVDPLRIEPRIGEPLRKILLKLMAREPADRYATAFDLEKDLLAFLTMMGITEPEETLGEYLRNPEMFTAGFADRTIEKLMDLGQKALKNKNRREAIDHFERVLAYDGGNERAMQIMHTLRARAQPLSLSLKLLVVVMTFVFAGTAFNIWRYRFAPPEPLSAKVTSEHKLSRSSSDARGQRITETRHEPRIEIPADAAVDDRAVVPNVAENAPQLQTHLPTLRSSATRSTRNAEVSSSSAQATRIVRFNPSPQRVFVSIDGAPKQEFGPSSFDQAELRVGRHRVRYTGDGLSDTTIDFEVAPGTGPQMVSHHIPFSASIHVNCGGIPASVFIDNRELRRKCGEIDDVSMSASSAILPMRVEADGYRTYTGTVNLNAGQLSDVRVSLSPNPGAP